MFSFYIYLQSTSLVFYNLLLLSKHVKNRAIAKLSTLIICKKFYIIVRPLLSAVLRGLTVLQNNGRT